MSYAITLRRMTPQEAAFAVYGPDLDLALDCATPWERKLCGLRGISADDAASQVMPKSTIRSTAGFRQADYNNIVQAAANGNFVSFNPSGCSGVTPSGARIVSTVGGLALTGLSAGFAAAGVAASIAGPVTAGASLLVGLFTSLFNHHAQAVKREQQTVCASVPAASDSLKAIDQAVQAGTISPEQGIEALQNLLSGFQQTVAPIIKSDSSHCNAACIWVKQLSAIVLKKSSDYQDLAAEQSAAALPASSGATGTQGSAATATITGGQVSGLSNVPAWAWLAAAAGLIFVVSR